MTELPDIRRQVAGELLGAIDEDGYCQCPGAHFHTSPNRRRDCRLRLNGAPTVFCVHTSCAAAVDAVNFQLRSRIGSAEHAGLGSIRRPSGGAPSSPKAEEPPDYLRERCSIPAFDQSKLMTLALTCRRDVTLDWLAKRSPVAVPSAEEQRQDGPGCSRLFLDALYSGGERILIFTEFYSQGDYLAVSHGSTYRLEDRPGLKAAKSGLPSSAPGGVWFLTAPVTGLWKPHSGQKSRVGRRHEACATRFPYLLLESDKADQATWLKALMQLPLPIAALYTSGGRSVHALVRVDCKDKAGFDSVRNVMRAVLCPLGADGAAMSAVRLSRLPGALRHGSTDRDGYRPYSTPRLQRLVYLNPSPPIATALIDLLK